MRVKKIGIECDDDFRLGKIADHLAVADVVAIERIPDTPARRGKALQDASQLRQQSRRADWFGKNAKRSAAIRSQRFDCQIQRIPKITGRLDRAAGGDRLGAVRIVKIENIGLRPDCGRAEARRMRRIPFHFCWASFVTGHQQSLPKSAILRRSRKSQRLARNHDLGLFDVGNNSFQRLFGAGIESGKGQRRAG